MHRLLVFTKYYPASRGGHNRSLLAGYVFTYDLDADKGSGIVQLRYRKRERAVSFDVTRGGGGWWVSRENVHLTFLVGKIDMRGYLTCIKQLQRFTYVCHLRFI